MEQDVKRRYRSPLREGQAEATRQAILDAASRLFIEDGYGATSIDAIAEAAGVSRATVFTSVGGKPVLLKTAYDVALVGDDEAVPLPERPRSMLIRAEPVAARYLELYAELITEMAGRLAAIYEAVRGAAGSDPEVRAVWEKIQTERRIGAAHVVDDIVARHALRSDIDPAVAADLVWVLNDPGLFHMLVQRARWTPDRFQAWLTEALRRELLTC